MSGWWWFAIWVVCVAVVLVWMAGATRKDDDRMDGSCLHQICDYAGCRYEAQGDGRPFCKEHHNTDEGVDDDRER